MILIAKRGIKKHSLSPLSLSDKAFLKREKEVTPCLPGQFAHAVGRRKLRGNYHRASRYC